MRSPLQPGFADYTAGRIIKRQTTYWDVMLQDNRVWRIHFTGKEETRFTDGMFPNIRLLDSHPLLVEYQQGWGELYISSPVVESEAVIDAFERLVREETDGWRLLKRYLNPLAAISLQQGYGLLLNAPQPIVEKAQELLADRGIAGKILVTPRANHSMQLLLLGCNYIIARSFTMEA